MTLHERLAAGGGRGDDRRPRRPAGVAAGVDAGGLSGRRRRSTCCDEDNAEIYWERSDRFDTALDLTAGRSGHRRARQGDRAPGSGIWSPSTSTVEPLTALQDVSLTWYVGLDAQGTAIGDALWSGEGIDEATRALIVALFRLTFSDPAVMIESVRGDPVYLILAMTPERRLIMKPQNLVTGLPIRQPERWADFPLPRLRPACRSLSPLLDMVLVDQLGPFLGRRDDKALAPGGRHRHWHTAELCQAFLDCGVGERGIDRLVELVDDVEPACFSARRCRR